jgi:hypothetical protein
MIRIKKKNVPDIPSERVGKIIKNTFSVANSAVHVESSAFAGVFRIKDTTKMYR